MQFRYQLKEERNGVVSGNDGISIRIHLMLQMNM